MASDQSGIAGNPVAGMEDEKISRHQITGGDVDLFIITENGGLRRSHVAQGLDRPFGAIILKKPKSTAKRVMTMIAVASMAWPRKAETTVAAKRMRMRIFLNCSAKMARAETVWAVSS